MSSVAKEAAYCINNFHVALHSEGVGPPPKEYSKIRDHVASEAASSIPQRPGRNRGRFKGAAYIHHGNQNGRTTKRSSQYSIRGRLPDASGKSRAS